MAVRRHDERQAVPTMSTAEFVPARPGSWTLADREAASHEAQHAVAAVLFDVDVVEVRIDKPVSR